MSFSKYTGTTTESSFPAADEEEDRFVDKVQGKKVKDIIYPISLLDIHLIYKDLASHFGQYGFFFKSDSESFATDVLCQPKIK